MSLDLLGRDVLVHALSFLGAGHRAVAPVCRDLRDLVSSDEYALDLHPDMSSLSLPCEHVPSLATTKMAAHRIDPLGRRYATQFRNRHTALVRHKGYRALRYAIEHDRAEEFVYWRDKCGFRVDWGFQVSTTANLAEMCVGRSTRLLRIALASGTAYVDTWTLVGAIKVSSVGCVRAVYDYLRSREDFPDNANILLLLMHMDAAQTTHALRVVYFEVFCDLEARARGLDGRLLSARDMAHVALAAKRLRAMDVWNHIHIVRASRPDALKDNVCSD